MRIVFIGSSGFGLRCLQRLTEMAICEVVGVVTAPATFNISYRPSGVTNVLYADVGLSCKSIGIPCAEVVAGMNDVALFSRVQSWKPDMFIVVGWYHMVPGSWRRLAPAYGLHASLLPDYSGGAPLVWAIINGEKRTGITLFQLDDGVDSGPIVGQVATDILHDDTIATLYERIEELGLQLLNEHLSRLANGTSVLRPQDETRRRLVPQRSPESGLIDWQWPAERVRNFVRAQTHPYPGAYTLFRGEVLHVWDSRVCESRTYGLSPGKIVSHQGRVVVGCGVSGLELLQVGMGTEDLRAIDWWRSRHLTGKEHLGT